MARDLNDDDVRIAPLGDLSDFEVAEGHPDIRGWRVDSVDGREVGRVHELLVDVDVMRTRYLDVRLTSEVAATPHDRDVLVPIGAARLDEQANAVIVPLSSERISLLPPYDHEALSRAHEYEVRRHFSLGEAEAYDDRRFFTSRGPTAAQAERLAGDTRTEADVRIPVSPEDHVVLKKGTDGNDEIIIRRPIAGDGRAP